MKGLIRFTQRNASLVLLASLLVVVFGLLAARNLKQELLPDINFPVVTVVTPYPLAAPSEVETQVTRPLETALANLKDLDSYSSTSSENVSVIVLNFRFGTDLNQAEARVNSAVSRVRAQLPQTATDSNVASIRFGDAPILNLVATAGGKAGEALQRQVAARLVPQLEAVAGVSRVDVTGKGEPEVRVTLRPADLREKGVTFDAVAQALQAAPLSFPVGTLKEGNLQLPVKIEGAASTVAALSGLVVGATPDLSALPASAVPATAVPSSGPGKMPLPGAGNPAQASPTPANAAQANPAQASAAPPASVPLKPVLLADVADVELVTAPASSVTRFDGQPALGLAVYKAQGANTVQVAEAVKAVLNGSTDLGADVQVVQDQATPIQKGVKSLLTEGLFGALFAVLVVALFLRDVRATLITALSIPVSLLVALILLHAQGLTLNVLTLGGLTVALGRLIDDAIVVVENIYHKLDQGLAPRQATLEGASEVASPVLSSTLATVAVFLPLAFVSGVAGEFLRPLALAVTLSILASLLVAFTLVPLLGGLFLRRGAARAPARVSTLERLYAPVIAWVTRRPGWTLALALAALIGSASLVGRIPTNFIDPGESDRVQVNLTLPAGTRLDRADAVAADLERRLKGVPGLASVETTAGTASGAFAALGGGGSGVPVGLTLIPEEGQNLDDLTDRVEAALKGVQGELNVTQGVAGSGGFSNALKINIQADRTQDLNTASARITQALKGVKEVENVRSSVQESQPQLSIRLDSKEAVRRGVVGMQAVSAVQNALSGKVAASLPAEDGALDVRVTYPEGEYGSVAALKDLTLRSASGAEVRLGDIARIERAASPVSLSRENGQRLVTVQADPTVTNISAANSAVKAALKDVKLPAGATWSLGGVTEQQDQAFSSLGVSILAAVGLVYLIMVAAFRSLLTPLILLVSIPLVAVGAFPLMALTGTPLGLSTMFAFLLLTGIVVTNAIVLIDLVEHLIAQGKDVRQALREGGGRRVRPIVMTALATIFALLPLALGLSESAGIVGKPLAVTVIGGLTSSTVLTLAVVPALYLLVQGRRQHRVRERRGGAEPHTETTV